MTHIAFGRDECSVIDRHCERDIALYLKSRRGSFVDDRRLYGYRPVMQDQPVSSRRSLFSFAPKNAGSVYLIEHCTCYQF